MPTPSLPHHKFHSSHLPLDLLRLPLRLTGHLMRLPLGLARHLLRLPLSLAGHFFSRALGFLRVEADGRFEVFGCFFCGERGRISVCECRVQMRGFGGRSSDGKIREHGGSEIAAELTAFLNALHGRIADTFVHGLDGLFGGGIFLCERACGKADADAVRSGQGGPRGTDGNGAEERHVFCWGLEMGKLALLLVGSLGVCEFGGCFGR